MTKQHGNMYVWVTHTFNVIKGECPHSCSYCYCKAWGKQRPLHFDESELSTNLGICNYIFVGSGTDMWSKEVPDYWIDSVLERCRTFPQNTYLFQSKNPQRFHDWINDFPMQTILATTIESSRCCCDFTPNAPCILERLLAFEKLPTRKTITIEPIMDFDLADMVSNIRDCKPEFVSIGADSKGHHLPEPASDKILRLIDELQKFTIVKQKGNLKRLL